MQLMRYNPCTGKKSSLKRYKHEETSTLEITHTNLFVSTDETHYCLWLKSFGLVSWCFYATQKEYEKYKE